VGLIRLYEALVENSTLEVLFGYGWFMMQFHLEFFQIKYQLSYVSIMVLWSTKLLVWQL
jgi:hypothetical protein